LAGVTANGNNANTSGSNNTFLGYQSGPGSTTQLTNATAIGANALVSENNALVLGGTGANAVNVGIGTATPASTLDVQGTGNFTGLVTFAASGQTFPGTVGSVTAGTDLTNTGTGSNPILNVDTTKVPQLSAANKFATTQTISSGDLVLGNGNIDLPQTGGGNLGVLYLGGFPLFTLAVPVRLAIRMSGFPPELSIPEARATRPKGINRSLPTPRVAGTPPAATRRS